MITKDSVANVQRRTMQRQSATAGLNDTMLALADPTRRRIVERLSSGQARVTEIAEAFPISLNSVSKHIRMLERAGLVERRVVGREHWIQFRAEPLDAAREWITRQRDFWAQRLQAIDDLLAAKSAAPAARTTKKEKQK